MRARWLVSAAVVLTAIFRTGRRALKPGASRALRQQSERHAELVRSSSLFDADWYLATYPDVASGRVDPLKHYMVCGWSEGRDPGPDFATSSYLRDNPDVARSGINPLVHYLEFGYAEGRGLSVRQPTPPPPSAFGRQLAPAAPCVSFPVGEEPAQFWRRSYRLKDDHPDAIVANGWVVGYAATPISRAAAAGQFRLLRALSGFDSITQMEAEMPPRGSIALIDGWYVTQRQLRLRLTAETHPFVVRAFQHDPVAEGRLSLVGEGLMSSALDAFDINLTNAFFPILLSFAKQDGTLLGFQLMPFPSLCRGGQHYPELIAPLGGEDRQGTPDIVARGEAFCAQLIGILHRKSNPLIARIAMDLEDADGTQEIFAEDLQSWLAKVMQVPVTSAPARTSSASCQYLSEAIETAAPHSPRGPGAILTLTADMIPTIGALVHTLDQSAVGESRLLAPLLVGRAHQAQPFGLLEISIERKSPILNHSKALLPRWPRIEGKIEGAEAIPPAAIRRVSAAFLANAELIYPSKRPALTAPRARQPITWLIRPEDWSFDQLGQALQTLVLQTGSGQDAIIFVGPTVRKALAAAKESFGHVRQARTLEAAIETIDTDRAGFLGAGVMLHDNDTVLVLSALLESEGVATASCLILSTERQGRAWEEIKPKPPKFFSRTGQPLQVPEAELVSELLWGSNYPVTAPCPYLWVARSSRLREWIARDPIETGDAVHFCSSQVTASVAAGARPCEMPQFVPTNPARTATTAELFLG